MDKYNVFSDLEGFSIEKMIDKSKGACTKTIICGDIIDSGWIGKFEGSNLELKSYNLRNIHYCITNPNVEVMLGNRDLNKFRCYYLCQLGNTKSLETAPLETAPLETKLSTSTDYITQFNEGNINLDYDTYTKLTEQINTKWNTDETYKRWNGYNMKHWYSFWPADFTNHRYNKQETYNSTYANDTTFITTFNDIFGPDPA